MQVHRGHTPRMRSSDKDRPHGGAGRMEPWVRKNATASDIGEERPIDEAARRCLNLFFVLFVADEPPSTTRIVTDSDLGYGLANIESEKTKFRRDRNQLERAGIHIKENKPTKQNEESTWEIDWNSTGVDLDRLTREELETLLYASHTCDSVPFWTDIHALHDLQSKLMAALARKSCGNLPEPVEDLQPQRADAEPWLNELWNSFQDRKSIRFSYINAVGEEREHTVDIYGFFTLDGRTYFAGFAHTIERVLTYRTDRVRLFKQLKDSYEVPESFILGEYVFLPFDFSANEPVEAVFSFTSRRSEYEIASLTRGRGDLELDADQDAWLWTIEVRDLDAAACLALSNGHLRMKPLAPPTLVSTWTNKIERAVTANELE